MTLTRFNRFCSHQSMIVKMLTKRLLLATCLIFSHDFTEKHAPRRFPLRHLSV